LEKLGVRTVGDFIKLPADGISRRFGESAERLRRLAAGSLQVPFQPEPLKPETRRSVELEWPETDRQRLMMVIEELMHPLLNGLAGRRLGLSGLCLQLVFGRRGERAERLRPASPTLDAAQILELIRLRLEGLRNLPESGISKVALEVEGAAVTSEQLQLFAEKSRRDLAAANQALARVRAELGEESVRYARLREAHLPEGTFSWENLERLKPPGPLRPVDEVTVLVRRLFPHPIPLLSRQRHEPDGWMLRGLGKGHTVDHTGPYIISGGWWRKPVHREYYFLETDKGEFLWVFYDRLRRRWFLQGRLE
jgi:protein ImuB